MRGPVPHGRLFPLTCYTGGDHSAALRAVNIDGTRALVEAAYAAAFAAWCTPLDCLLDGRPARSWTRRACVTGNQADDYYRSKIDADAVVSDFLAGHPTCTSR